MSGGHWNNSHSRFTEELREIALDRHVAKRWPLLSKTLLTMSVQLYSIIKAMDYDLSSDSFIEFDKRFDIESVGALLDGILRETPDECFSKMGKWAVIQAFQRRTNSEESDAFYTKNYQEIRLAIEDAKERWKEEWQEERWENEEFKRYIPPSHPPTGSHEHDVKEEIE